MTLLLCPPPAPLLLPARCGGTASKRVVELWREGPAFERKLLCAPAIRLGPIAGHCIVSLSGGAASAVAADRAIQRYGRSNVTLWFSDTNWEDEDLYRFLNDCMIRWGGKLVVNSNNGLRPPDVWEDKQIIPNDLVAPCSDRLKIAPFVDYLATVPKSATVCLGMDWKEKHRMLKPFLRYTAIPGVFVDYPLMWKPWESMSYQDVVHAWGIDVPRLYGYGASHNNCKLRCCRQGVTDFRRLQKFFPEQFDAQADWELAQQAKSASRANRTIVTETRGGVKTPVTLKELGARPMPADMNTTMSQEDMFACVCSV